MRLLYLSFARLTGWLVLLDGAAVTCREISRIGRCVAVASVMTWHAAAPPWGAAGDLSLAKAGGDGH